MLLQLTLNIVRKKCSAMMIIQYFCLTESVRERLKYILEVLVKVESQQKNYLQLKMSLQTLNLLVSRKLRILDFTRLAIKLFTLILAMVVQFLKTQVRNWTSVDNLALALIQKMPQFSLSKLMLDCSKSSHHKWR